jgi:hypothetical protein
MATNPITNVTHHQSNHLAADTSTQGYQCEIEKLSPILPAPMLAEVSQSTKRASHC